ncbi:MAG: hypothetical protein Roseis2KO_49250 [Roseivirga sp.]
MIKKAIPILILAMVFSCTEDKRNNETNRELIALQTELDSLKNVIEKASTDTNHEIATFLTFQDNNAEEAMNFYVSLFKNSRIIDVQRYGEGGPAKAGTILMAKFELNGSAFACSDSYTKHLWNFTPGVSIWVECKSDDEIENLLAKLSENGKLFMPLDNYGFSQKFAFVEDRFGVSWQLNLN